MANLRKRVAACDLERRRPTSEEINPIDIQKELENHPLIPKVSCNS